MSYSNLVLRPNNDKQRKIWAADLIKAPMTRDIRGTNRGIQIESGEIAMMLESCLVYGVEPHSFEAQLFACLGAHSLIGCPVICKRGMKISRDMTKRYSGFAIKQHKL